MPFNVKKQKPPRQCHHHPESDIILEEKTRIGY